MSVGRIRREIEEKAEATELALVDGAPVDWPEYQKLVGRARALREVLKFINDLPVETGEDIDDDR